MPKILVVDVVVGKLCVVVDSSISIVNNKVVLILLEENRYPHHYLFSSF